MSLTAIKLFFSGISGTIRNMGLGIMLLPFIAACLVAVWFFVQYEREADKLIECNAIRVQAESDVEHFMQYNTRLMREILDLRSLSEEEHAERLWLMDNYQDQRIKNETLSERLRKKSQRSMEAVDCAVESLPDNGLLREAIQAANTAN